ncbi:hypothetical protein DBV05_g7472 [Lasiodiplodia theobromae]|uniref:Rhodopsin domain-containing protein n=1 Tax=Lasiodiplodia theobromae TaxID=45133 RepID=A0A5N5D921_9PEZI|nr:hypothetical protein DBV05_g7472 [Lasiodiplodia theobromae]
MVAPGLTPPEGEVSDFSVSTSSVKSAALAVDIVGIALTTALVALRFTARHLVSGRVFALDDMIRHGGGIHQWDVPEPEVIPFFQSVYSTQLVYGPTVFATKASILFFLTRVFQPFERYCRFIYGFTAMLGIYYILMLFLKIFICRPIHLFWAPESSDGECFDQRALILADNIISLVSDIAVLVIPCPLAGGLKVGIKAKLRIAAVFGVGGFACVCTFIRLIDIIKMGGSPDATYSFTLINLWGIAEVGIGIVCACFPVMPAFWKYLHKQHPSQMTSSYQRSGGRSYGHRSGHRSVSGIELKKSHHSRTITEQRSSVSMGGKHTLNGSDENMLIPHDGKITVSVRGGEDLEMGKAEHLADNGQHLPSLTSRGKSSYDDQGIVRTVEVQMMREPK